MKSKRLVFYKITLSIFISFFVLSFTSLIGDGVFLNPSIAESSDIAIGFTADNPGIQRAIEVQSRHSEKLMGIPGVVGHGIGISSDGEPIIKIFVTRAAIPGIPTDLEGLPIKVEVTGKIVAYSDPTARFPRPVPIGVSTGHPDITAGTIGCRVTDAIDAISIYALSNNHVYANQNDAAIGDDVLQPGPYDGGEVSTDMIGTLYDFEPIDFSGGNNTIDAAIALSSSSYLGTSTPDDDGYGIPSSTIMEKQNIDIELKVQKYGRTTGLTHGTVATINTTVDVCYETRGLRCIKMARFVDQIGITPGTFSAGGDSGSLIVTDDENKNPVGLLFAGSNAMTFANRIDLVLDRFGVTVDDTTTIPPENVPPTANFSSTTSGLTVYFSDQSYDSDGTVETWSWNFGDDNTSTAQNPIHTYAVGGTYTVILTVTDNDEATDSLSKEVIAVSDSSEIILTVAGSIVKDRYYYANLEWSGATSRNVDIYRDGELIATTKNDGAYTDKTNYVGHGSYTYKVCEQGTATCSDKVTVTF